MKTSTIVLFTILTIGNLIAQNHYGGNDVRYESCTNCNNHNAVYGAMDTFGTRGIISDFGPRFTGSFWHGGVDYTVENVPDDGYHVLSVEDGFVRRIRGGAGQKYPEIVGTNMHLMYNHCFNSAVVTQANPIRVGDLELVILDSYLGTNTFYQYGILQYGTTDTTLLAACPNRNCTQSYKIIQNDTIFASDNVLTNQIIGSIGTSADTNANGAVASHLHLQRFRSQNLANIYATTNLIDPLEHARHKGPEYEIEILKNSGIAPNYHNGIEIKYPGTNSSDILARTIMPDVDANGNDNNGHGTNYIYFNNTMNWSTPYI